MVKVKDKHGNTVTVPEYIPTSVPEFTQRQRRKNRRRAHAAGKRGAFN